jgi:hypothetical protein
LAESARVDALLTTERGVCAGSNASTEGQTELQASTALAFLAAAREVCAARADSAFFLRLYGQRTMSSFRQTCFIAVMEMPS